MITYFTGTADLLTDSPHVHLGLRLTGVTCLVCTHVLFATDNGVRQLSVDNAGFQFYERNVTTSAVVPGTCVLFLSSVVVRSVRVQQ